jgi:two-component system response regulator YesN
VSPPYLSAIFHKEAGVKFNDYVNITRIEKAKEMLKNDPAKSVTEVFITSGFSSIQNFNRVFRKIEGVSPKKFRKNL